MFSAWMIGVEDEPNRCGEICLVEVFGDTVQDGPVGVRLWHQAVPRPGADQEFGAEPRRLDVLSRTCTR